MQNSTQRVMIDTLRQEGFDVNERALMRLRGKHGLLLRKPNPSVFEARQAASVAAAACLEPANQQSELDQHVPFIADASQDFHQSSNNQPGQPKPKTDIDCATTPHPSPLITNSKRKEDMLAADSLKWQARKRRRHTKPFAGLPPDAPGPPRYPSETTIGECQTILNLDTASYKQLREAFRDICNDRDIVKKSDTLAVHWNAAKNHVVDQINVLHDLFQSVRDAQGDMSPLQLALDAICMDVTKNLRIEKRKMTLAQAKNALNVDPAKSQELRSRLLHLLSMNGFINKHESLNGKELKDQWLSESGLQAIVDAAPEGHERQHRTRAVAMLYRDYMKRWRDAVVSDDVAKFRRFGHGAVPPEPLAIPSTQSELDVINTENPATRPGVPDDPYGPLQPPREQSTFDSERLPDQQTSFPHPTFHDEKHNLSDQEETPLDPSLLQTAQDSSAVVAAALAQVQEADQLDMHHRPQYLDPPIQVFFRRSATSPEARPGEPSLWSGSLAISTLDSLCKAALDGYPAVCKLAYDMHITTIQGIASSGDELGEEIFYRIDDDFELVAYLNHVGVTLTDDSNGGGPSSSSSSSTATFSVSLSASDIADVA